MSPDEVFEALENTATKRNDRMFAPTNANENDIEIHRKIIMRFLESIDDDMPVAELLAILEEYGDRT